MAEDAGEISFDPNGAGPLPLITIKVHRFVSLVGAAFAFGVFVGWML